MTKAWVARLIPDGSTLVHTVPHLGKKHICEFDPNRVVAEHRDHPLVRTFDGVCASCAPNQRNLKVVMFDLFQRGKLVEVKVLAQLIRIKAVKVLLRTQSASDHAKLLNNGFFVFLSETISSIFSGASLSLTLAIEQAPFVCTLVSP